MFNWTSATSFVVATIILTSCGPEEPRTAAPEKTTPTYAPADYSSITPAATEPTGTCDPLISDALVETVDVLFARGFEPGMVESFTASTASLYGCGNDPAWNAQFKAKAPPGFDHGYQTWIADVGHDIYTGDRYDFTDPVAVAESLPDCFATEEGYKTCTPEFHPYQPAIDGNERITADGFLIAEHSCRLDDNWKKFCTLPTSLDGCWSFAKADLISAPPSKSAQQSRIQLARAVRTDRVAQGRAVKRRTPSKPRRKSAAPGSAPTPLSAEERRLPICDALQWEYLLNE